MKPYALQARYLLTMDGRPPIENGIVTIADERIVAVGENLSGQPVLDLDHAIRNRLVPAYRTVKSSIDSVDVALLPGFVNAHTHLEFSDLEAPLGDPGMPLPNWIRAVLDYRKRQTIESDLKPFLPPEFKDHFDHLNTPVRRGIDLSQVLGTTTIGDIATQIPNLDSYAHARIDFIIFCELLGLPNERLPGLTERSEMHLTDIYDHGYSFAELMPHMLAGLSPHAPYSIHPAAVRAAAELSSSKGNIPLAMHIAESREELELLATSTGLFRELLEERGVWQADAIPHGSRPLDYLQMLSPASRALIIHGNYLELDELEFIAKHRDRMSLVYCPRTHAYFQHEPYPLEMALELEVPMAIGTDSLASNPDLSMLAELRFVARQFPKVSPDVLLHMGTTGSARSLGFEQAIGTIEPGKLANLVAIELPLKGNPYERLLHGSGELIAFWHRGNSIHPYMGDQDYQATGGVIDDGE